MGLFAMLAQADDTWTADQLKVIVLVGVALLAALFVLLMLVRWWATRLGKNPLGTELDLETIRRQRDAGQISQEEYEAIRAQISGAASAHAPPGGELEDLLEQKRREAREDGKAEGEEPDAEEKDAGPADGDEEPPGPERSRGDGEER